MSFVTKISPQKRRPDRYNIFLDGKYTFPVSEEVLLSFGLKDGLELSDERIQEIVEEENYNKFYIKILDFLSYRIRSKDEVVKRLREYLYKAEIEEKFLQDIEERIFVSKRCGGFRYR